MGETGADLAQGGQLVGLHQIGLQLHQTLFGGAALAHLSGQVAGAGLDRAFQVGAIGSLGPRAAGGAAQAGHDHRDHDPGQQHGQHGSPCCKRRHALRLGQGAADQQGPVGAAHAGAGLHHAADIRQGPKAQRRLARDDHPVLSVHHMRGPGVARPCGLQRVELDLDHHHAQQRRPVADVMRQIQTGPPADRAKRVFLARALRHRLTKILPESIVVGDEAGRQVPVRRGHRHAPAIQQIDHVALCFRPQQVHLGRHREIAVGATLLQQLDHLLVDGQDGGDRALSVQDAVQRQRAAFGGGLRVLVQLRKHPVARHRIGGPRPRQQRRDQHQQRGMQSPARFPQGRRLFHPVPRTVSVSTLARGIRAENHTLLTPVGR